MQPPLPATPDSDMSIAGVFKNLSERSIVAEVSEIWLSIADSGFILGGIAP